MNFGVVKNSRFPYHICNCSRFSRTKVIGTICSVFGDQYYPQDVVLPFGPTCKIWRRKKPKFPLTEFPPLLPCKGKLSLVQKNIPTLTSNLLEGSMRKSFRKVPIWAQEDFLSAWSLSVPIFPKPKSIQFNTANLLTSRLRRWDDQFHKDLFPIRMKKWNARNARRRIKRAPDFATSVVPG